MILMMQKNKYPPDGWEDYALPYFVGPPQRGDRRRVESAEELADALCKGKIDGTFRIVMRDGTIHQIIIEEVTTVEHMAVISRLV